jgi:serine phosphatase RsbU (regulator of sigma subunit)/ketosteroid isomerase-like protein
MEQMPWFEITVVAVIALAISLVVLLRRERKARRRLRMLADLIDASDPAHSLEETYDAICAVLVPGFADFCMIDLIGEDRVPRRAAVRVGPGRGRELEEGLATRTPSTPPRLREDQDPSPAPRFYERMTEDDLRGLAHDEDDLEFLRSLEMRSAITVALQARGRVAGALTVAVGWSGRRYRREDARFASILAGRIALALDNAGLFADLERAERARAEIGETLQHGLLPPALPRIHGWSIAAMYRPAGAENEVGGDFYDVFRVPGGWMLAVGDVTGRGARAASITAVARYTLRTAAILTDDPLTALRALNRALLARGDSALCSLAAVTLSEDPAQPVRLAVAGHPPPLVVDGEAIAEAMAPGPILGAFREAEWKVTHTSVEPGQQLVIVTDGIAEAHGPTERFGEARLREQLRGAANSALALQQLGESLEAFTGRPLDDDVAAMVIAPEPEPEPDGDAPAGEADAVERHMVERLYEFFNHRDESCLVELCDDSMEFLPTVTAEAVGRETPYRGQAGLRDYLDDVAQVWEELRIAADEVQVRGERVLVRGRVYARSRELGIRNVPAAWIWEVRDGRFVHGAVFPDPEPAIAAFDSGAALQRAPG